MKNLTKAKQDQIDRARKVLEAHYDYSPQEFNSAKASSDYFMLRLATEDREHFEVAFLNSQNELIETVRLFSGTLGSCPVFPREIAKQALLLDARSVILAHNHPSGSSAPSRADREITSVISEALGLFDIPVLDHVIVARSKTYSFAEHGMM